MAFLTRGSASGSDATGGGAEGHEKQGNPGAHPDLQGAQGLQCPSLAVNAKA